MRQIKLTSLPASLLCKLTAARESWPPSRASTNCLETFSPNATLSLQPPQIHPLPPENNNNNVRQPGHFSQHVCLLLFCYVFFLTTCLPNSGIVAATVVQVSHAAVFGKRVHNSGRANCVDERRFPCAWKTQNHACYYLLPLLKLYSPITPVRKPCVKSKFKKKRCNTFFPQIIILHLQDRYEYGTCCITFLLLLFKFLPLRSPLCVDNWSVFSGQFHLSQANWCLHSCIPLCAPSWTLLA